MVVNRCIEEVEEQEKRQDQGCERQLTGNMSPIKLSSSSLVTDIVSFDQQIVAIVYGYAAGFSVRPVRLDCILVVKVGRDTVSQPEVIRKLNLVLLGTILGGDHART
jgi:hypothetical protein